MGILEIKKHLKGRKPKKVEKTDREAVVTNVSGEVKKTDIRIFNILEKDPGIEASISRGFNEANRFDPIDGLHLHDYLNKKKIETDKQDIEYLSSLSALIEPREEIRKKLEEARLTIVRIVFEPGYMWQFYHKGYKINAAIRDDSFYVLLDEAATRQKKN